jgi:hypothetical protein
MKIEYYRWKNINKVTLLDRVRIENVKINHNYVNLYQKASQNTSKTWIFL